MLANDTSDQRFLEKVRPLRPARPEIPARYDFLVIGGGASGIAAAREAKRLGAERIALVEAGILGGDRLAYGAVPMLALLGGARKAAKRADLSDKRRIFAETMEMMRRKRNRLADDCSAAKLTSEGIDLFFGRAAFDGPKSVAVDLGGEKVRLEFAKALIASGATNAVPQIPGFSELKPLQLGDVFDFETLPERLAVMGAGPHGVEVAQAFARFGSEVYLIDKADRVLPQGEERASELLLRQLEEDGVKVRLLAGVLEARQRENGVQLQIERFGNDERIEVDRFLVFAGRVPNVKGLALENCGVEVSSGAVLVNGHLQTTARGIYACGDVVALARSPQSAEAQATLAVRNALKFGRESISDLVVPWVAFTEPEIAHVGRTEAELKAAGAEFRKVGISFTEQERGLIEEEDGEMEILLGPKGEILGADAIHPIAGELLAEISLAMARGLKLQELAGIHRPFPTRIRALGELAEAERRRQQSAGPGARLRALLRKG